MEIKKGDVFKSTGIDATYTVKDITEKNGKQIVEWECSGEGCLYVKVALEEIVEWLKENHLEKI